MGQDKEQCNANRRQQGALIKDIIGSFGKDTIIFFIANPMAEIVAAMFINKLSIPFDRVVLVPQRKSEAQLIKGKTIEKLSVFSSSTAKSWL